MEKENRRILLVDGDPDYVRVVESVIVQSEKNITFLKAFTGNQALQLIHKEQPDLVISNISLPDMDGYQLCCTIKNDPVLCYIPILIVTSMNRDSKLKIKLLEAGAEAFLEKPFGQSEFLAHVRSLLRLKKAEDRLRDERDHLQNQVVLKERVLSEQEERMALILDNIIEGIWDWDIRDNTIFLSSKFKRMLGYEDNDLTDTNIKAFLKLICPIDKKRFLKEVDDYLNKRTPVFRSEARMCYSDGTFRWFLYNGYALWDSDNKPVRLLGVQSDITESKENLRSLEKIALEDYVTRLPNRVLFYKMVAKVMNSARRNKGLLGFVFIDLDKFKPINDTYGHYVGDMVLRSFAEKVTKSIRPLDILARFAGDEFILSLPEINDISDLKIVIDRTREIMKTPLLIEGNEFFIEFSAGYSLYPDEGDNLDDLLKLADKRMYEDKQKRKKTAAKAQ